MTRSRRALLACLTLTAVACRRPPDPPSAAPPASLVARATAGPAHSTIRGLTPADLARIDEQVRLAERLAASRGLKLDGTTADLRTLQRLVDSKAIAPTQTYELQSLGIALGRVMKNTTPLVWVAVEDEYGRDPALNVPGTSVLLFPMTMISKRVEEGRALPIEALYEKMVEEAERMAAAERAHRAK